MRYPHGLHFSLITSAIRHSATIVEIVRWYAGPRWCSVSRVYNLTPSSAARLSIIYAGLRAGAH